MGTVSLFILSLHSEIKTKWTTHTMRWWQSFLYCYMKRSLTLSIHQLPAFKSKMDFSSLFELDKLDLKWTWNGAKQTFQVKNLKAPIFAQFPIFPLPYFLCPRTLASYSFMTLSLPFLLCQKRKKCILSPSELNSDLSSILITYVTLGKIFMFLSSQCSQL